MLNKLMPVRGMSHSGSEYLMILIIDTETVTAPVLSLYIKYI